MWIVAAGIVTNLFNNYKRNAKRRNVVFKISRCHFKRLIAMDCYICGSAPMNERKVHKRSLKYNGVDRVDNTKGYIRGNVKPCCGVCNRIKWKFEIEDLENHLVKMIDGLKRVG